MCPVLPIYPYKSLSNVVALAHNDKARRAIWLPWQRNVRVLTLHLFPLRLHCAIAIEHHKDQHHIKKVVKDFFNCYLK